ncbi:hypothetical protein N430_00028 [Pseudomonas sp. CC120222-01a]|nr:hypothetical protein N430_00028 [Pseudomonas sp. CC120222-01a]
MHLAQESQDMLDKTGCMQQMGDAMGHIAVHVEHAAEHTGQASSQVSRGQQSVKRAQQEIVQLASRLQCSPPGLIHFTPDWACGRKL